MIYGRGISRPRGASSRKGATSVETGQAPFNGHSKQVLASRFEQKRPHNARKKAPRRAEPQYVSSAKGVITSMVTSS